MGTLSIDEDQLEEFVSLVRREGERLYRALPWRNIDNPYHVLVSEVMLQQTQVGRVEKYWTRFIGLFPSLDALASAETSLVLEQWQGLGYNRRALALKKTAEICSASYDGELPQTLDKLLAMPGIGQATAAGVMSFAYNEPSVYLETNVRTVFIHEFFSDCESVSDSQIVPLVEATCPQSNPRAWYYALLDYGSFLKREFANPSRKSAHHSRQSKFEGSRRQKRAEMLRVVLAEPGIRTANLYDRLDEFERESGREPEERDVLEQVLSDLLKEGFFRQEGDKLYS